MPPAHAVTAAVLQQQQADRQQLDDTQTLHRQQLRQANVELDQLPRWVVGRRKTLTAAIAEHQAAIGASLPVQVQLDHEVDQVYRQTAQDTRDRQDRANQQQHQLLGNALFGRPAADFAGPRPIGVAATAPGQSTLRGLAADPSAHHRGLHHDDDRGLSR